MLKRSHAHEDEDLENVAGEKKVHESAAAQHRREVAKIALVVSTYFVVSIALVFMNKLLMAKGDNGRNLNGAPIFIIWFQMLVSVACCAVLGSLSRVHPMFSFHPQFEYDPKVALKIAPLSMVFVGMIAFNNLCLKYVPLSFYNIARSLTICFNVLFTKLLLGKATSTNAAVCCSVVVAGFFLGSTDDISFDLLGTIFGVLSSVFVSLNSIYVAKVMPFVQNNQWKLSMYNSVNAALIFPLIMFGMGEVETLKTSPAISNSYFWFLMIVTALLGFAINIATYMQIKVTSPLTHNIAGTAKACVQTVFAYIFIEKGAQLSNILSNVLVVSGSAAYSYVRMMEMKVVNVAAHK